jgi:TldD protein
MVRAMATNRRDFLKGAALGTALVTLPGGLAGCRTTAGPALTPPGPVLAEGYFEQFEIQRELLQRVIARGLARGAEYSEVFLQHKVTHVTGLEDGEVNRAFGEVTLGAGIRAIKGDATGFAFTEDLSERALLAAAATAAAVADGTPQAQPRPVAIATIPDRYRVRLPWSEVGVDRKLPLIRQAEALARKSDRRISKVTVAMEDETSRILVADSDGRLVLDDQPMTCLWVSCVAEDKGRTEASGQSLASRDSLGVYTPQVIEKLVAEAVDHTVRLFGASPPPPGQYPVVLAPGIPGILLHEAIGHGMEADFNRKGVSIYSGRVGQRIAPRGVTIVDEGVTPRLRGTINIDDEGASAERTVLVEDGILRSYMHDRISAGHFRVGRTGSGRRESFRFPPVPRMRNTYMLAGTHAPEEIIGSVKKGLYAEMFSNGQVMIGAGDFTFYLKHGRMIEDGKLTRVVKDANLIGSGPKVLEQVKLVGNDLKLHSGAGYCGKDGQRIPVGFGLPTLLCQGMSIGGRS